jgi:hypothetical protein
MLWGPRVPQRPHDIREELSAAVAAVTMEVLDRLNPFR